MEIRARGEVGRRLGHHSVRVDCITRILFRSKVMLCHEIMYHYFSIKTISTPNASYIITALQSVRQILGFLGEDVMGNLLSFLIAKSSHVVNGYGSGEPTR